MIFAHNKKMTKSCRNFDIVADENTHNYLLDVRNASMPFKYAGDTNSVVMLGMKIKFSVEISEMLLNT